MCCNMSNLILYINKKQHFFFIDAQEAHVTIQIMALYVSFGGHVEHGVYLLYMACIFILYNIYNLTIMCGMNDHLERFLQLMALNTMARFITCNIWSWMLMVAMTFCMIVILLLFEKASQLSINKHMPVYCSILYNCVALVIPRFEFVCIVFIALVYGLTVFHIVNSMKNALGIKSLFLIRK